MRIYLLFGFIFYSYFVIAQERQDLFNTNQEELYDKSAAHIFSVGFDLIAPIKSLSGQDYGDLDLEVIGKLFFKESALRFRVRRVLSTGSDVIFNAMTDSSEVRTYYSQNQKTGFFLGIQQNFPAGKFPIYYGADAGVSYEKGVVGLDRREHFGLLPKSQQVTNREIEVSPFIGVRFDFHSRWFLNIEIGPRIIMERGERIVYNLNKEPFSNSIDRTYLEMSGFLRDISINFRF